LQVQDNRGFKSSCNPLHEGKVLGMERSAVYLQQSREAGPAPEGGWTTEPIC